MQNDMDPGGELGRNNDANDTTGGSPSFKDLRREVSETASGLAAEVKQTAGRKVEETQRTIGESMASFAKALRAAGDILAADEQQGTSRLFEQAAGGIEKLGHSIENESAGAVLENIRSFGRDNGGALFAGSLLAGLAFGRLIKSGTAQHGERAGSQGSARNAGDPPSPASSADATAEIDPSAGYVAAVAETR